MKNKAFYKLAFLICSIFLCIFLSGCNFDDIYYKNTSNTVTFEYPIPNNNIMIYVAVNDGGTPSNFTLSASNKTQTVTWTGKGTDYFGDYKATWDYSNSSGDTSVSGITYTEYSTLKKVTFYNKY